MVKHIEYYECGICNAHFENKAAASKCEADGLVIPKFKIFEVVRINDRLGVVYSCGSYQDSLHHEVRFYTLQLKKFFGTWQKEYWCDLIEKYPFVDCHCPICKSNKIELRKSGTFGAFYPRPSIKFPVVNEIEFYYCRKCQTEFYSEEQSKKIDEIVRQTARYPIKSRNSYFETKIITEGYNA